MYLKSIEVQGFKSFANKMVLKFENGITGIVGPNGSGKSNVADAVRWVLGEQRIKQLRGSSMQDVIFSGTELRKPLSYAYVAITLDNSDHALQIDYDEVTVSRRIYRSGESEYLINGTQVRLKDVNELFYDTGIGKEGYSIIGQGQIDRILSGKPEERRELFDETAGIVKFKRRKITAQKKLEDERANMVRISDILGEKERQLKPLERQSEKAREYLKRKDELKTLDVNVFLLENARMTEQLKQVSDSYELATKEYADANQRYESIKEEYQQIQEEIDALDLSIETRRQALSDTGSKQGKLEVEINVLKEQIRSIDQNDEHQQKRRAAIEEEINQKQKDLNQILDNKSKIDSVFEEAQAANLKAKELLQKLQDEIDQLNADLENGQNTIVDTLTERAGIKTTLGRLETMLEQAQIKKAELTSKLLSAKTTEDAQNEEIKKLEESFEAVNVVIRELNQKQKDTEDRLADIKTEMSSKDAELQKLQALYHMEKSKLEALANLTERYEGYGGSVKRVMEQKDKDKKIIGVVADIIKTEKKYETAIEIALGGNIQNIVTEDEDTAKRMIQFLKECKGGRATFLPLTSITNPQEFKTPEVLKEKGVIGMADELVSIDDKYKNVAKAMLGRIVVVDHIDQAVKIARKFDYGVRMVTLEGELLVPGGAISGGAFKNNSNLLGRRREMDELEKRVAECSKKQEQANKAIEELKAERNKLRTSLEEIKNELQTQFIAQNTARMNVIAAKEKKEATEGSFDALRLEQQDIEEQLLEINKDKENAQKELTESELLEKNVKEQLEGFQKTLEKKRMEELEQSTIVNEKELEAQKISQQQGFQQENVDRIQLEIDGCNKELDEIVTSISKNKEEKEFKANSIKEIEQTIEASSSFQSEAMDLLKKEQEKKDELTGKQRGFFDKREELQERLSLLDKEVYRQNAQKEKLEESLEGQIAYMWDEYEITLSDAAKLKDPEMTDLTGMRSQIQTLKAEIKKLGDVNVNAIEEYKETLETYTTMKTQYDDLVEAEKSLVKIIDELDSQMRKQFNEKFDQIKKEFDRTFKELFGGGKGTLELVEDEDVLEAGIRVIAQPPGKKLQNMMMLSGGEKALTAIALLFAIQGLKPSPFCLLDEIEAALDESNVSRFAKYLDKLTKHTQFIVITHRRGTMECADRLYGITMQEKGISALVSVDLIDNQLDD